MAWHAGLSEWKGESSVNGFSVGIEIVHPGDDRKCNVFPIIQMNKVSELIADYQTRYPAITPCTIIAHGDIAPGRKIDPNAPLLWKYLAEEKQQGLWSDIPPQSNATCLYGPTSKGEGVMDMQERLGVLGYKITANGVYDEQTHRVVSAFHRHFDDVQDEEMWDQLSDDRLNDVLQKAEDYGCL